jgi:exo-beta-1,3-glucanase (GH17 family)
VFIASLILCTHAWADWEKTICYAPTNFNPNLSQYPDEQSIAVDLQLLYDHGFRGLCSYSSDGTLAAVPRIARSIGFQWIIMGVWCPTNEDEVQAALDQAPLVDGYCVNNEGLPRGYSYCAFDTTVLASTMDRVRTQTGKPVTTSEQIEDYLAGDALASWLLRHGDWLFVNCHPFWAGHEDPEDAIAFVQQRYQELTAQTQKPVVIKETGLPSAGCQGCSEGNQREFWRLMRSVQAVYCRFEAFDQPWKDWHPVEPHWGFFNQDRDPKPVNQGQNSWGGVKQLYR